jgi:hypothetical protein
MNLISEEWMVVEAEKRDYVLQPRAALWLLILPNSRQRLFEIRMPVAASTCRNPVVPVYFVLCALYIF